MRLISNKIVGMVQVLDEMGHRLSEDWERRYLFHKWMPRGSLHIWVIAKEHPGKPGAIMRQLEGE